MNSTKLKHPEQSPLSSNLIFSYKGKQYSLPISSEQIKKMFIEIEGKKQIIEYLEEDRDRIQKYSDRMQKCSDRMKNKADEVLMRISRLNLSLDRKNNDTQKMNGLGRIIKMDTERWINKVGNN